MTEPAALLALYDETMRRQANPAGCLRELTAHTSRYTTSTGSQRYIMWHSFLAADAGRIVDEELMSVRGNARVLMWKLYAHDAARTALRDALCARVFSENDHSTLMVTGVSDLLAALPADRATKPAIAVRQLRTVGDLDAYQNIWDAVWPDAPNARYVNDYRARIEQNDPGVVFFAGFVDNDPVTSGYMFHHPGSPYALLCGGTTKAAWRRQHAYTRMLRVRAQTALERGVRYLAVEASPESKPILERLGFVALSTLAFYEKHID